MSCDYFIFFWGLDELYGVGDGIAGGSVFGGVTEVGTAVPHTSHTSGYWPLGTISFVRQPFIPPWGNLVLDSGGRVSQGGKFPFSHSLFRYSLYPFR